MGGAPVPIRSPQAVRPWQHVLNPLSGYLELAQRLAAGEDVRGGWNFGPDPGDVQTVGWLVERLTEMWPTELRGRSIRDRIRTRRAISRWTRRRRARSSAGAPAGTSPRPWRRSSSGTPSSSRPAMRAVTLDQIERSLPSRPMTATCRFCAAPLETVFADLGMSPLANSYLPPERGNAMEPFYPLKRAGLRRVHPRAARGVRDARGDLHRLRVLLVVLVELARARRALRRVDDRALRPRRRPARSSRSRPTTATCCSTSCSAACRCSASSRPRTSRRWREEHGHPARSSSSSASTPRERWCASDTQADLLLGNNVLAHVPDLNDFVGGMKILLADGGVDHDGVPAPAAADGATTSSTRSTTSTSRTSRSRTVSRVFEAHGLRLFDVEEIPTHGGSLRIYGCHADEPRSR